MDYSKRDKLLDKFLISVSYKGGIQSFKQLDIKVIKELIANDYIRLSQKHNNSPTVSDYIEFLNNFPQVKVHGFVESPQRDNSSISFEGCEYEGVVTDDLLQAFTKLFRKADVFETTKTRLYCWYD